jgi:stage III sporulation protein AF
MMEFLSEWMRGLILIIFLAVALDMILPNNAMQRYVKLVMGLLIILLMLSPLLKFYGTSIYEMDFTLDKMLAQDGKGLPSLEQIEQKGMDLQERQAGMTIGQWKAMVAESVKRSIEKSHQVTVDKVEMRVTEDDAGRPTAIEQLEVVVMPKQEKGAVKPVEEVKPVIIGKAEDGGSRSASAKADDESTSAIVTQLSEEYQVPKTKISVIWQDA